MKKHFLTTAFACLALNFCLSPKVEAKDWLDQMDQQFEETFQQSDAAFDRAMRAGVEELDKELAEIWGESRKLPEPKIWVGYSKDKKKRIVVDYIKGEMSIEGFDQNKQSLQKEFQDFFFETPMELDERAALKKKLIRKTKKLWQSSRPVKSEKQDNRIKRTVKKWQPINEFARLVAPKATPRFERTKQVKVQGKVKFISRLTLPLRKNREKLSAKILSVPVLDAARKYNLPRALIFSVIKNESAFNPRARSHANALGLMQLVATSGGKEAYSYLEGENLTPGPDVLYNPAQNILLGSTYLHLLNTRYFGKVKNAESRRHLIIAAYNTGAGNVAKAFTGKMKLKAAIEQINSLTPSEVFDHLVKHLPYQETRTYLTRVNRDLTTFADWDQNA